MFPKHLGVSLDRLAADFSASGIQEVDEEQEKTEKARRRFNNSM